MKYAGGAQLRMEAEGPECVFQKCAIELQAAVRKVQRPQSLCRAVGNANLGYWHPSMTFRDMSRYVWSYGQSPAVIRLASFVFGEDTYRYFTAFVGIAYNSALPVVQRLVILLTCGARRGDPCYL